jgi:hypothetical protein
LRGIEVSRYILVTDIVVTREYCSSNPITPSLIHPLPSAFQPEERAQYEIAMSQAYAARVAKRSRKEPRMRTIVEDDDEPKGKIFLRLDVLCVSLSLSCFVLLSCFYSALSVVPVFSV